MTTDVYKAINKVQAALAATGIGKDRKNESQGYKFRGIDDVYNAVSGLLAANGLCILPRCTERNIVERTNAKGTALFYVTVRAEFDFVAASDGSRHTVVTYGEAMDSGDKATNKAMSAAYKYALMQTFAIPTEGDNDADAATHEVRPLSAPIPANAEGKEVLAAMDGETRAMLDETATTATRLIGEGKDAYAYLESLGFDPETKLALWTQLDSKTRGAIKKQAPARAMAEQP